MLKFSPLKSNAKLKWMGKNAYSISTLSGVCCPYANECKSQVVDNDGKRTIKDGPNTVFRCYSASQELLYKAMYKQRKHNHEEFVKAAVSLEATTNLILNSIPDDCNVVRWHVAGDFLTQRMFDAAIEVAKLRPDVHFYAYTKSLPFWVKRLGQIPDNFILTASMGGKADHLIEKHNLRYVKVVYSEYEAKKLKLPVDHDDKYAMLPKFRNTNFALVIHGVQPKDTKGSKVWSDQIKGKRKFHGYSNKVKV